MFKIKRIGLGIGLALALGTVFSGCQSFAAPEINNKISSTTEESNAYHGVAYVAPVFYKPNGEVLDYRQTLGVPTIKCGEGSADLHLAFSFWGTGDEESNFFKKIGSRVNVQVVNGRSEVLAEGNVAVEDNPYYGDYKKFLDYQTKLNLKSSFDPNNLDDFKDLQVNIYDVNSDGTPGDLIMYTKLNEPKLVPKEKGAGRSSNNLARAVATKSGAVSKVYSKTSDGKSNMFYGSAFVDPIVCKSNGEALSDQDVSCSTSLKCRGGNTESPSAVLHFSLSFGGKDSEESDFFKKIGNKVNVQVVNGKDEVLAEGNVDVCSCSGDFDRTLEYEGKLELNKLVDSIDSFDFSAPVDLQDLRINIRDVDSGELVMYTKLDNSKLVPKEKGAGRSSNKNLARAVATKSSAVSEAPDEKSGWKEYSGQDTIYGLYTSVNPEIYGPSGEAVDPSYSSGIVNTLTLQLREASSESPYVDLNFDSYFDVAGKIGNESNLSKKIGDRVIVRVTAGKDIDKDIDAEVLAEDKVKVDNSGSGSEGRFVYKKSFEAGDLIAFKNGAVIKKIHFGKPVKLKDLRISVLDADSGERIFYINLDKPVLKPCVPTSSLSAVQGDDGSGDKKFVSSVSRSRAVSSSVSDGDKLVSRSVIENNAVFGPDGKLFDFGDTVSRFEVFKESAKDGSENTAKFNFELMFDKQGSKSDVFKNIGSKLRYKMCGRYGESEGVTDVLPGENGFSKKIVISSDKFDLKGIDFDNEENLKFYFYDFDDPSKLLFYACTGVKLDGPLGKYERSLLEGIYGDKKGVNYVNLAKDMTSASKSSKSSLSEREKRLTEKPGVDLENEKLKQFVEGVIEGENTVAKTLFGLDLNDVASLYGVVKQFIPDMDKFVEQARGLCDDYEKNKDKISIN